MANDNGMFDVIDQQRLEVSQSVRDRIVAELTKDGAIPKDKEDRQFLMQALSDSDRSVFNKARIKVDEKAGQSQQASAAMIASILLQINEKQIVASNQAKLKPVLDNLIQVTDPVPGETDIGVQMLTYDEFMQKT